MSDPLAPGTQHAPGGGWISGPSVTTEEIPAEHVRAGDRLVLDDDIVIIDDIRAGWYWIGELHQPGIAFGWRSASGQSSGVIFRRASDGLFRVAVGDRP